MKFLFPILSILAMTLFETREYWKYSISSTNCFGVKVVARLDGTYQSGKKDTVTNPYSLFVSFSKAIEESEFEVISIRLSDQSGCKNIVSLQYPNLKVEKKSDGTGIFNYIEVPNLTLDYVDYCLMIVFKIQDEEKEANIKIKTDYKKKTVNRWWEKASSI